MRICISLTIMLLLFSSIPIYSEDVINGKTLYVGGSGEGNYTSIQDAIDDANDGDTIFVYSGIYNESILVYKSINLMGEDMNNTIIVATFADGVNITASHASIKNFTISKSKWEYAGLKILSDNCIVENCRIYGNDGNGLHVVGEENEIGKCIIYGNMIGAEIEGNRNKFYASYLHENGDGINVRGNENEIRNCIIERNRWGGIRIIMASQEKIINCRFYENGLSIDGRAYAHFTHEISNNTINGKEIFYFKNETFSIRGGNAGEIIAVGCKNFGIEGVDIEGGDVAIEIAYCENGEVRNCSMQNGEYGLLAYNSSHLTIYGSSISDIEERGMEMNECSYCIIRKNVIDGINDTGLLLWKSCSNIMAENRILNALIGILIFSYSDGNNVSFNEAYMNGCGISVQGGSYNSVYRNELHSNECGISIAKSWSRYNKIVGNNVTGNKNGIYLQGEENFVRKNSIEENENYGIYLSAWLSKCRKNVIEENNFIANKINAGFEVDFFSLNLWRKNYWDDWNLKIPKPIYGYALIQFNYFGIKIPWVNFDMAPSLERN